VRDGRCFPPVVFPHSHTEQQYHGASTYKKTSYLLIFLLLLPLPPLHHWHPLSCKHSVKTWPWRAPAEGRSNSPTGIGDPLRAFRKPNLTGASPSPAAAHRMNQRPHHRNVRFFMFIAIFCVDTASDRWHDRATVTPAFGVQHCSRQRKECRPQLRLFVWAKEAGESHGAAECQFACSLPAASRQIRDDNYGAVAAHLGEVRFASSAVVPLH